MGIDLAASSKKPSAFAVLDESAALSDLGILSTDGDILALAERCRPRVVAIDAPLSLPQGWHCLSWPCRCGQCTTPPDTRRSAERALVAQGIGLFWTTKRSIIKPMVERAIGLARALAARKLEVIEVYPYATKVRLFNRPIPKKARVEGRRWLEGRLAELVPGVDLYRGRLSHDDLDAIVAAYTAYLFGQGRVEALGEPREGLIVVPLAFGRT